MKLPVYVNGEGAPLLMIHGIISDASFFSNISCELSSEFKVITYDRRGYGACPRANIDDYSIEAQAEDAHEIIKEYAPEGCFVLGNSAGGLVAIELCLRYPGLIKGMLLLEPSLHYDKEASKKLLEWNIELNRYKEAKKIKKALAAFTSVTGSDTEREGSQSLSEMKQTFINLENFIYGELNEIQNYTPILDDLKSISKPVKVLISSFGKDSIYAQSAIKSSAIIGWKTESITGFHNAIKDRPKTSAVLLNRLFAEMNCNE